MIFKGTPNMMCRVTKRGAVVKLPKMIRFDKEGHFETDNPKLIKRMSGKFDKATLYKCKQGCGFTTFSKTELMRHYKTHKENENDE